MARDWSTFNADVIEQFRANDGVVPRFGDLPLVILHTIGARSGKVRLVPLIPVLEKGATYLFATSEGSPTHPAWYFNLVAHSRILIEHVSSGSIKTGEFDVELLPDDEAATVLNAKAATEPQLVEYLERASPRLVPVFRITPSLAA